MPQQQQQKHVMLSYEWEVQSLVLSIYDYLVAKQVPVWMDIKAGIPSDNLYEGIAKAIENSSCFVCFMTPDYQESDFCKQELQYAKQCNIPIIPLKLQEDWNPTSWLGFITAGLLWLDFYHIKNFEEKAFQLYNRICKTVGKQFQLQNSHKSIEVENVFRLQSSSPPRTYSSRTQNDKAKYDTFERTDLDLRVSVQNLVKQFSPQTLDKYKMKDDVPKKITINQSKTFVNCGMSASSTSLLLVLNKMLRFCLIIILPMSTSMDIWSKGLTIGTKIPLGLILPRISTEAIAGRLISVITEQIAYKNQYLAILRHECEVSNEHCITPE
ncbi:unnamed protein product [Rotaria sordida]|uniref:TIR domain-containing protein n=1 Tax=Rotaria sordida TaxID=392033 RepID=A0A814GUE7_9BILA|nr:unnamed protein product [Rotaria sordida]CAF1349495.1 unnamed protein product [Rotaria sordida]